MTIFYTFLHFSSKVFVSKKKKWVGRKAACLDSAPAPILFMSTQSTFVDKEMNAMFDIIFPNNSRKNNRKSKCIKNRIDDVSFQTIHFKMFRQRLI